MKPGTSDQILGGDTAACNNGDCPSCEKCLRYMGKRSPHRQVYGRFLLVVNGGERCDSFIEIEETQDDQA